MSDFKVNYETMSKEEKLKYMLRMHGEWCGKVPESSTEVLRAGLILMAFGNLSIKDVTDYLDALEAGKG